LKLEISDAILVAVKEAGDNVLGRTSIQKLIYFLSIFGKVDVKYLPHYYGPYSADVAGSIQMLSSIDFLDEKVETQQSTGYSVPENWRRYLYSISEDGEQIIAQLKESNEKEYNEISRIISQFETVNYNPEVLSWAAKVNYIISKKGASMTPEAIINTAGSFGWKLTEEQVDSAIEILKNLNLCK
jgi:uncharacterized protein YwgA